MSKQERGLLNFVYYRPACLLKMNLLQARIKRDCLKRKPQLKEDPSQVNKRRRIMSDKSNTRVYRQSFNPWQVFFRYARKFI